MKTLNVSQPPTRVRPQPKLHMKAQTLGKIAWLTTISTLFLAGIIQPVIAGSFTTTGSMSIPRTDFTATLLLNGKVLATGGDNATNQDIAAAELYDPATGTWTNTGSMTTTRLAHAAVRLPNGKVLVEGGAGVDPNNGMLATAEL